MEFSAFDGCFDWAEPVQRVEDRWTESPVRSPLLPVFRFRRQFSNIISGSVRNRPMHGKCDWEDELVCPGQCYAPVMKRRRECLNLSENRTVWKRHALIVGIPGNPGDGGGRRSTGTLGPEQFRRIPWRSSRGEYQVQDSTSPPATPVGVTQDWIRSPHRQQRGGSGGDRPRASPRCRYADRPRSS